jgi:hypothetical protein
VKAVHPGRRFPVFGRKFQVVGHVDPFDGQDLPFFFDLAPGLGDEPAFSGGDVARFQRAS